MENKLPGYITLDDIIKSYKLLKNEAGMVDYARYMNILIDEVADYNIKTSQGTFAVKLPVSAMNTVAFPDDMTDYVTIGLIVNERIWSFTLNPNIPLITDIQCGEDYRDVAKSNSNVNRRNFLDYWKSAQNDNYFRVDYKKRLIIIEGALPAGQNEVYLEYRGTGIDLNEKIAVPREMKPLLTAYLAWKDILYDDRYPEGTKQVRENLYGKEREKLRNLRFSFSLSEWLDVEYQTSRMGAKY